ncbi:beta-xylosidase [Candidatus Brocadia sinica JPN1]|uniref:Beta-xylosidase n=1 Tax=Candidatus Brocadia sinica JPN1 TaxID=1197129 RepID=A0ABQ0JSX3_9BACT|nr:beta-xylosidase [Candidatus Brocadia sinica JPN1]
MAHSKDVEKESNIGERFHHDTSLTWLSVIRDLFRGRSKKPPQYKNYPDSKIIKLPNPVYQGISLEEAIVK